MLGRLFRIAKQSTDCPFNRLDAVYAWLLHNHEGMDSESYAALCKLEASKYHPGYSVADGHLTDSEALEAYATLARIG